MQALAARLVELPALPCHSLVVAKPKAWRPGSRAAEGRRA
jgi:hypothetical protein